MSSVESGAVVPTHMHCDMGMARAVKKRSLHFRVYSQFSKEVVNVIDGAIDSPGTILHKGTREYCTTLLADHQVNPIYLS